MVLEHFLFYYFTEYQLLSTVNSFKKVKISLATKEFPHFTQHSSGDRLLIQCNPLHIFINNVAIHWLVFLLSTCKGVGSNIDSETRYLEDLRFSLQTLHTSATSFCILFSSFTFRRTTASLNKL